MPRLNATSAFPLLGGMALIALVAAALFLAIRDARAPGQLLTVHTAHIRDTSYEQVRFVSLDGGKTQIPQYDHIEQFDITTDVGDFRVGHRAQARRFEQVPLCLEVSPARVIRHFLPLETCLYAALR